MGSCFICSTWSVWAIARPGMGKRTALCVERIAGPFRALGCPLRNAGALCSWLSREAPRAADPPELAELHEILTGGSWVPQMVLSHPLLGAMDQAEEPGLEAAELEELVCRRGRRTFGRRDPALAAARSRCRAKRCRAARCRRGRGAWRRRWPSSSEALGSPGLAGW